MEVEKIRQKLIDFQENELPKLFEREVGLTDSAKIQTLIGARRIGKTSIFYEKINALIKSGVSKNRIIFLNFESPYLSEVSFKEIRELINLQVSLFPSIINQKIYLFIDEPQTIDKWELAVRELDDELKWHIFITGSSSKLLSREIATHLRGRTITKTVLTLSLREFLEFKKIGYNRDQLSTNKNAELIRAFNEFIEFGGYPEVVLEKDGIEKLRILKDYLDLTIFKDIIERFKLKNTKLVRWLIDYLISTTSREFSTNKLFNDFKSRGVKVSKNTLYEYFSTLNDAFFIHSLQKFSQSPRNESGSIPKVYLNDIGFMNLYSIQDNGKKLENLVFLELLGKANYNPLIKLNYWRSAEGKEVDFVLKTGQKVTQAIQVAWSLADKETIDRELDALEKCMDEFKLKEAMIITAFEEKEFELNNKKIKAIPAWKWMIEKR